MNNDLNSPLTAAAIGAAMESACASGDLEVAERLFESYRRLFAEQRGRRRRPRAIRLVAEESCSAEP